MESRVLVVEAMLKKMGEILPLDMEEEMKKKYPEAWPLLCNLSETKEGYSSSASEREKIEHTGYLENRVDQLLVQNERQNEEISKQASQIKTLQQTVKMLMEIAGLLNQEGEKKAGEINILKDKVDRLEAEFEAWKQTERHSLADFLPLLEEYPASQNKDVNTIELILRRIFKDIPEKDREWLDRMGRKEPEPSVQFNKPVYEVNGNERVNIGKQN